MTEIYFSETGNTKQYDNAMKGFSRSENLKHNYKVLGTPENCPEEHCRYYPKKIIQKEA